MALSVDRPQKGLWYGKGPKSSFGLRDLAVGIDQPDQSRALRIAGRHGGLLADDERAQIAYRGEVAHVSPRARLAQHVRNRQRRLSRQAGASAGPHRG